MEQNVKALRAKLKLDQTQFWRPLGVTQSGGSRYENGRRIPKPLQLLMMIAHGNKAERERVIKAICPQ